MDLTDPPFDGRCPFAAPANGAEHTRKRVRQAHYGDYLRVGELLALQDGPSALKPEGATLMHHEEMTFIVVHQTFELWFKLIIGDLGIVRGWLMRILNDKSLSGSDVTGLLYRCLPLLRRVELVMRHATESFAIMETMHPSEFLEFRDYLIPASGFQSVQWRILEESLGLENAQRSRVNGKHVYEYLYQDEKATIEGAAEKPSLRVLIGELMKRLHIPETFDKAFCDGLRDLLRFRHYDVLGESRDCAEVEIAIDKEVNDMAKILQTPHIQSDEALSPEAIEDFDATMRGALFVQSYRHEAHIAPLAELLDLAIAVETQTLLWRTRHLQMVNRMIGARSGTGGTVSGSAYLESTRRYKIFKPLWLVRKLFLRPSVLPSLDRLGGSNELLTKVA